MNKDMAFVLVLVVLIVFSAYQAVQIAALRTAGVGATTSAGTPAKSTESGNYNLPSNLKGLNTMVGGC